MSSHRRRKANANKKLADAVVSGEQARTERTEQELKLEQERETIVQRIARIHKELKRDNHVTETLISIIRGN